MKNRVDIFMIAGEASADLHGASLLEELKEMIPGLSCFGVGGERLRKAGMEVIVPADALNVVGISDWLDRIGEVIGAYRKLKASVVARRPTCAVLLDLPDLNLKMAAHLKRLGVPVVYYISPQVWAWRKYRIHKIKKFVDRMLVLFPFEKEFYEQHQVDVEFVGHPLVEQISARGSHRMQKEVEAAPRVAILPGSRLSEVRYHGQLLSGVCERLRRRFPRVEIKVPIAPTLSTEFVKMQLPERAEIFCESNSLEILEWADIALVASGTATLETALIGTPFCLFYRMSGSSGFIAKHFLGYQGFFGMPNLLRRKEVAREFVHDSATVDNLENEAIFLITNEDYRRKMVTELLECRRQLETVGASRRAASQVRSVLELSSKTGRQGVVVPTGA